MRRPFVWMAVALVLGEWMAQDGIWRSVEISVCAEIVILFLYGGIHTGQYRFLPEQMKLWFGSGMLLMLPLFCIGGGWLRAQAEAPTPFVSYIEAKERQTGAVQSGINGTVYGIITQVETEEGAVRLWLKEAVVIPKIDANGTMGLQAGQIIVKTAGSPLTEEGTLRFRIGSHIQTEGWIYRYPRALNPGQFDTRTYYLGKNVQAGMQADTVEEMAAGNCELQNRILLWKLHLAEVLAQICETEDSGIFQAILLGMSRQVDAEQKELFQAAGIAHLLSVSGLHISCLAMMVYQSIRRSSGSFLVGFAGGSVFLFLYGILVGNSASAIRAMVMFGVQMLAACYGRKYDLLSGAGLAAMGILGLYPLQILQSGFWMTFLAVIGIGVVHPVLTGFIGSKNKWMNGLLFSLSIQLGTLPVVLYSSFTYPVYGILLNLVVIPLAAYLLCSGAMGALTGLVSLHTGMFFIGMGHFILWLYDRLSKLALTLPGARFVTGQPKRWQCFLYYGILAVFLYMMHWIKKEQDEAGLQSEAERRRDRQQKVLRLSSLVVMVLGLYCIPGGYRDGALHLTMLDVGQGECLCLQLPDGETVVIDGGSTDVSDVATYRILPFLLSQGISKIDLLVLTHPDADHINGMEPLLLDGRIMVGELYLSHVSEKEKWQEIMALAEALQIPVHYAAAGEQVTFGEVTFTCLHPEEGSIASDPNDNSIVLQMAYRNLQALFTGDLPTEAEDFLEQLGPISLFKVAHHGSKYASSEALLEICQPQLAIISCGAGNRYGHPHKEVLDRLEAIDCPYYVTAGHGALLLKTRGNHWSIEQYE